jgi:hypothetical protein
MKTKDRFSIWGEDAGIFLKTRQLADVSGNVTEMKAG